MSGKDLDSTQPLVIKCAIFTTAITMRDFRARDVLFYVELIKDMVRTSPFCLSFDVQITQILRILKKYEKEGMLQRDDSGKKPIFRFHSGALVNILESLTNTQEVLPVRQVLFLQSYLDSYSEFLRSEMHDMGLKTDSEDYQKLEEILAPGSLIQKQIELLEKSLRDLDSRIQGSQKLMQFLQKRLQETTPEKIVAELPSEFSYQLSYLKPFKEWLAALPNSLLKHEFEKGFEIRYSRFYLQCHRYLSSQLQFYREYLQS